MMRRESLSALRIDSPHLPVECDQDAGFEVAPMGQIPPRLSPNVICRKALVLHVREVFQTMRFPAIPTVLALAILVFTLATPAYAQQGRGGKATDLEIAQLPPYCQARVRVDRAQMKLWADRLGREHTLHLHHFCNGLIYYHRATHSFDEKERRQYLNRTVGAMSYVLKRWPPEFPLYREAETYKTQAEKLRQLFNTH